MGSRASKQASLPGPPTASELAYLAGLLDRAGGFTAARAGSIGMKITCGPGLRRWLLARFGGYETSVCWWLTRQADVAFLLPRLRPYLVERHAECQAMYALLGHLLGRQSYHGDPEWRGRRDALMAAVRAARWRTGG